MKEAAKSCGVEHREMNHARSVRANATENPDNLTISPGHEVGSIA